MNQVRALVSSSRGRRRRRVVAVKREPGSTAGLLATFVCPFSTVTVDAVPTGWSWLASRIHGALRIASNSANSCCWSSAGSLLIATSARPSEFEAAFGVRLAIEAAARTKMQTSSARC